MITLTLPTTGRRSEIRIARGLLHSEAAPLVAAAVSGRRALIVSDTNVEPLHLAPLAAGLQQAGFTTLSLALEPGEENKTAASLERIYHACHLAGLTRRDTIIALGGGVIGDLGGFAAATWQRGIYLVQVPTTLMAQVDSSVGGKTAIDMPYAKNTVGAFYQPHAVLVDPDTLRTLPEARLSDGLAEVVKYAAIRDPDLLELLEGRGLADLDYAALVERSIRTKADYVLADEFDQGLRMQLNFGHTLGHAIEQLTGYGTYFHGEAVSIGMMLALRLGAILGITPSGLIDRLGRLLTALGLPTTPPPLPAERLLGAVRGDKKLLGDSLNLILIRELGQAIIHPLDLEELAVLLAKLPSLPGAPS